LDNLKEIENYRKREKSIGIPIIVNDENFFEQSENNRYNFLKQTITQKVDLLIKIVEQKKLDTKIESLKSDLDKILS
jgi:macrodomain Ter protein organizer (MatP/YcbG family)